METPCYLPRVLQKRSLRPPRIAMASPDTDGSWGETIQRFVYSLGGGGLGVADYRAI